MACGGSSTNPNPNVGGGNSSDSTPQGQFKTEAVAGFVNGSRWTLASGTARQNFFEPSQMQITLSDTFYESPCREFFIGNRLLLARASFNGPSLTQFGQGNPIETSTFSFENDSKGWRNLIATRGKLQITSITDTEVTGAIIADYDKDNSINGTFVIPICPGQ